MGLSGCHVALVSVGVTRRSPQGMVGTTIFDALARGMLAICCESVITMVLLAVSFGFYSTQLTVPLPGFTMRLWWEEKSVNSAALSSISSPHFGQKRPTICALPRPLIIAMFRPQLGRSKAPCASNGATPAGYSQSRVSRLRLRCLQETQDHVTTSADPLRGGNC